MKEYYQLETAIGNDCEKEIERRMGSEELPYKKERSKTGSALYKMEDKNIFLSLCVDMLLAFYKKKEIVSVLRYEDTPEYYAIVGTLLSIERDTEQEELKKLLSEETSLVLDGYYHFCMREMRAAWRGISGIGDRLYKGCESEEDKLSLLLYLLDLQEREGKKVRISNEGLFVSEQKADIVGYCPDKEKNLVINIFSHRPEMIELEKGYRAGKGMMTFLRRLSRMTLSPID